MFTAVHTATDEHGTDEMMWDRPSAPIPPVREVDPHLLAPHQSDQTALSRLSVVLYTIRRLCMLVSTGSL